MSDILIRGMEMPSSCWDCYFQDCGNCVLNNHKVVDNCIMEDRRDEDCPLLPVPPHGRLIDGDKLAEEQKENVRAYHANLITLDDLAECLLKQSISEDGAPTIIPAEPCKEKGE